MLVKYKQIEILIQCKTDTENLYLFSFILKNTIVIKILSRHSLCYI